MRSDILLGVVALVRGCLNLLNIDISEVFCSYGCTSYGLVLLVRSVTLAAWQVDTNSCRLMCLLVWFLMMFFRWYSFWLSVRYFELFELETD